MDIDPEAVKWLQVIVEHNCTVGVYVGEYVCE